MRSDPDLDISLLLLLLLLPCSRHCTYRTGQRAELCADSRIDRLMWTTILFLLLFPFYTRLKKTNTVEHFMFHNNVGESKRELVRQEISPLHFSSCVFTIDLRLPLPCYCLLSFIGISTFKYFTSTSIIQKLIYHQRTVQMEAQM